MRIIVGRCPPPLPSSASLAFLVPFPFARCARAVSPSLFLLLRPSLCITHVLGLILLSLPPFLPPRAVDDDAIKRGAASAKRAGRFVSTKVTSRNAALNIAGGVHVDVFLRCRCVALSADFCALVVCVHVCLCV